MRYVLKIYKELKVPQQTVYFDSIHFCKNESVEIRAFNATTFCSYILVFENVGSINASMSAKSNVRLLSISIEPEPSYFDVDRVEHNMEILERRLCCYLEFFESAMSIVAENVSIIKLKEYGKKG